MAALVLLGAIAPFISGSAFSGRIQRALEASLGRRVAFGDVRFTLFSGPGFSLRDVTIYEDPRFGIEPFAYVPTLEARIRLDKLLRGRIAVSSLHLVDPSLNLVKREDGTWNVVELVNRVSAPSRLPLSLFPALDISSGRLDLKFGVRKSTLYIADTDVSIYPERSGKLYLQFSGSPARTDRAGNGFGHFRGTANWYVKPATPESNQLEATLDLEPSNLSELTTLIEGEDAGVHGTVSSHVRISGPAADLHMAGDLSLDDVHRWDLLPSSGEHWRIQYAGDVDLASHRLDIRTLSGTNGEQTPVGLQLRVNDFLTRPAWSAIAILNKAPVGRLLPISRRMGLVFPPELSLEGTVSGAVGYSNSSGLSGTVAVNDVVATLPNLQPLRASALNASISPDHAHFEPAIVETQGTGALRVGGDYNLTTHEGLVSLTASAVPIASLKQTITAWFGAPQALAAFRAGDVTGDFGYRNGPATPATWTGQFQFADATLVPPGFASPLTQAAGSVRFDSASFDLERFSAVAGDKTLTGAYHYLATAKRPERLHVDVPEADLTDIETILEPALRAQGLLARLGVARRSIPAWLASRNLIGDISIGQFSVRHTNLGALHSRLIWDGVNIEFPSLQLTLAEGAVQAKGAVNVSKSQPRSRFTASVSGFPWKGGTLSADGQLQTSGMGDGALQNLHAHGTFSGEDVALSNDDLFSKVSGAFDFSFADGWPDLRFSKVQVSQDDEDWTGAAATQSDGKLVIDLQNAGRQRRVVSTLEPQTAALASGLASR